MKTFYKSMMKIDLFSYSLLKSPKMFRFKTKYVYSNVGKRKSKTSECKNYK